MFDSGSDYTVLKLSIARKAKVIIEEGTQTSLKCFMGNIVVSNLKCKTQIMIEKVTVEVTAIILGDKYLRHDIIIGRNILANKNVIIVKSKKKLYLRT